MKPILIMTHVALGLLLLGCNSTSNVLLSSIGEVTDMHLIYPVGRALAIEITPNKRAVADKYYIVEVSYLKRGRCRTAISWTELEVALEKPKEVYIPLSVAEARTLLMENEIKLREIFNVVIDTKPMDVDTMLEMQEQGIIVIYR